MFGPSGSPSRATIAAATARSACRPSMWLRPHPGHGRAPARGARYSRFPVPSRYTVMVSGRPVKVVPQLVHSISPDSRCRGSGAGRPDGIDQRAHPFPLLAGHDRFNADQLAEVARPRWAIRPSQPARRSNPPNVGRRRHGTPRRRAAPRVCPAAPRWVEVAAPARTPTHRRTSGGSSRGHRAFARGDQLGGAGWPRDHPVPTRAGWAACRAARTGGHHPCKAALTGAAQLAPL